ncbi:MAG: alpha/beta fold hydrolase [Anaerolineales bacterium]
MISDFNSHRRDILVSKSPPVNLSVIDISPPRPKQTLIFLHGLGANAAQWQAQIDYFSLRYRVIAIELRGHGQSDPSLSAFERQKSAADIQEAIRHHKSRQPSVGLGYTRWPISRISHNWNKEATRELMGSPRPQLSMEVLLADLEVVLKKLNVKIPFVLVGHSLGGALAAEYAKERPYRLQHLILLATPPKFRLTPFTAFMLNSPSWLLPLAHLWLKAPPALLQEFHNRVLKYWIGANTLNNLYVPTLLVRVPGNSYYEPGRLIIHDPRMHNIKPVMVSDPANGLNQAIANFI